jgi:hypothetical protein
MTRHPLIIAAVAGALALGACGSDADGGAATGGKPDDDKAFAGALDFAKCMRERGIDMPDPVKSADGGVRLEARRAGGPGVEPGKGDPKMEAAQKACEKHLEAGMGEPPDPAEQARMQDALFAYARCMRAVGIDMPDPKVSGGRVMFRMEGGKGTGSGPESPRFKAADEKCHEHLAEVEEMRAGGRK